MAKRAATISPSSGDVEVYIAQANASIAAELAPAAAAVSPFTIEVRFLGGLTPKQKNAFKSAADRWSRVIVGDLPSVKVDNEVIDDVVILAQGSPIDDVGRILGQAGPTHLRPQSAGVAAFLPAKGKMTFDTADLKQMEQDDTLNDVITHEMGHVLGIGTVWTFKSLLKGAGKTNPTFLGKAAMKEFGLLKGPTVKPTPVPVENTGGPGTADSHWRETVFRNERSKEMIAWYQTVFGARVVHEDEKLAFLTWDAESHRLALVKVPGFLRYLFPLSRLRRKFYGIDHVGLTFKSLDRLLSTYERLKKAGITPVWSINHGPTTSLYYEDPDGIRLEFQTENFPTAKATADYFHGSAFAENPIGVNFDPDYLLERLRSGAEPTELLHQGAGTRPGTTARANRRAVTWKTL